MELAALKTLKFRFAKSMPHIPHEYVVRTPENQAAYVELFNVVQQHGVLEKFGRRSFRYWYAGDGFKYWTMTTDVDKSEIINRAKVDDNDAELPRD
jgi:hypothetical protein